MHQHFSRSLSEAESRGLLEVFRFFLTCVLANGWRIYAMKEPRFFERWVGTDDPVKDEEQVLRGHVHNFAGKCLQLLAGVGVAGVAQGVVVLPGNKVHNARRAEIPEIARVA